MNIAIIGTGRMAQNLGKGWVNAGHTIIFGSRTPERQANLTREISGCQITRPPEAIEAAGLVLIAIPFVAVETFASNHAARLQGKLVIDISNPFGNLPDNRIAGAEITAQAIGPGARVVAAFKHNFWETLLEPTDPESGLIRDVYFAGDNESDKQIVAQLVQDLGFRPVDCGSLKNARVLDGMVPLIVELDRRHADGQRISSWKLLP